MSNLQDGILTLKDLRLPDKARLSKGPVAVCECVQEIPCNPCVDSCPQKAIHIRGDINGIPELDFERCTGCGLCLAQCPGLAIFLLDETHSPDQALLGMPYEFVPLPENDEIVEMLDRGGDPCGEGRVHRIRNTKNQDRTAIVFLEVEKSLLMKARHFRKKTDAKIHFTRR